MNWLQKIADMNLQQALNAFQYQSVPSPEQLKKDWRRLAMRYHPDLNQNGEQEFIKLNEAYQFLQ